MTTKSKILMSSIGLFGEKGYSGTSLADIANSIGITKASMYSHFESKQSLFENCLSLVADEQEEIIQNIFNRVDLNTSKSKLESLLIQCSHNVDTLFYVFNYRFLYYPDPEVKPQVDKILQRSLTFSQNIIKDIITLGISNGEIVSNLNSSQIFTLYNYLLNGVAFDKDSKNNLEFLWSHFCKEVF